MRDINNQYSKPAMRKCKSISSIVLHLETKETLVCRSIIAIEGLRFLASLHLAGTGQTEGGEKTQPFNRFHSRLFIRLWYISLQIHAQLVSYFHTLSQSHAIEYRCGERVFAGLQKAICGLLSYTIHFGESPVRFLLKFSYCKTA